LKLHVNVFIRFEVGMTSLSRRGQTLNLGTPCLDRLTIAHELMHALGFHHEQNRPDRDQFIRVNFQNIKPEFVSQFQMIPSHRTLNTSFDIDSIMLYANNLASLGGPTWTSLTGRNRIRDREYIARDMVPSALDAQGMRKLYNCPAI